MDYSSKRAFDSEDIKPEEGISRDVRRAVDKQNKKARKRLKRNWVTEVRRLVKVLLFLHVFVFFLIFVF